MTDLVQKRRARQVSGQVSAPQSAFPSNEELVVTVGGEDVAVRIVENKHGEATVYLNGGKVQPWVTFLLRSLFTVLV